MTRKREAKAKCPYCHKTDKLRFAKDRENRKVAVWCHRCSIGGPYAYTPEEALDAWGLWTKDVKLRLGSVGCQARVREVLRCAKSVRRILC